MLRKSPRYYPFLAVLLFCWGCQDSQPATEFADLILENGKVYTFAWGDPNPEGVPAPDAPFREGVWVPEAEAVAIRSGRIVEVGSEDEVAAWRGPATEVIDLQGGTVLPGAVESHGHLQQIGEWHEEVDLRGLDTEEAIVDRIAVRAQEVPAGEWIVGAGWDEGAWANRLPTMALLSEKVPNHPVCLKGLRGFGTWGNQLAFERAGITSETPTPDGGEIVQDAAGNPTGILLNNATGLLNDAVPERTLEQKKRILRYGLEQLAAAGYVSAHHAGTRINYMPAYESLAQEEQLPIRVETMLAAEHENKVLLDEWLEKGPTADREEMLQVRSIKAFYDGSLGSRGARLLEAYADHPDHLGVSGSEYGFDKDLVANMMKAGFQVGIHAIGDAGNRAVLDFFERVYAEAPEVKRLRHRIEHAQVIHPDDFERFSTLDIVASMEPAHAVEDSPWAEDRVGPERILGAYAWRTLRRHGVTLIFNSDLAGTDYNLFYGLYSAITRQDRQGNPAGGWYPEQRLTPEEAVRAYTTWTAYTTAREDVTGTLEAGKWADITVMSLDPLNVGQTNLAELLNGKIYLTVVDGKVAFRGL